jgi:hypothetical protein
MLKDERGQRGKEAEKEVQDILRKWNTRGDFAWHRMADARAARGLISAQPCDYLVVSNGNTVFLEVKSLAHDYRIAKDKVDQAPTLWKFHFAGATALVLVLHTKLKKWRVVHIKELELGLPSWDLSKYDLHDSAQEALLSTGLF